MLSNRSILWSSELKHKVNKLSRFVKGTVDSKNLNIEFGEEDLGCRVGNKHMVANFGKEKGK